MLKDENTRLRVLAEHDWLTGLYNRLAAEAHVDEALLKNGGGMLLVLDIDHFKQVNDRYGHLIGDALLCEAARTLRDIFFPRDIIGRVGGDEFIIYILGGCSQEAVDGGAIGRAPAKGGPALRHAVEPFLYAGPCGKAGGGRLYFPV